MNPSLAAASDIPVPVKTIPGLNLTASELKREKARIRKEKSRLNKRNAMGEEAFKQIENKKRQQSYKKERETVGEEAFKNKQNDQRQKTRSSKKQTIGEEAFKNKQNEQRQKTRSSKRQTIGEEAFKQIDNEKRQKSYNKKRENVGEEVFKRIHKERIQKTQKSRKQKIGEEAFKKAENEKRQKSYKLKRDTIGDEAFKKAENEKRQKSYNVKRDTVGEEAFKKAENKKRRLSRKKLIETNPGRVKDNEKCWKQAQRLVDCEEKRILKFKQNTLENATFVCQSCKRNLFKCNMTKLSKEIFLDINKKDDGLCAKVFENHNKIWLNVWHKIGKHDKDQAFYICASCKQHLMKGNMPPMCAKNNLKIPESPNWNLTELEANIVARNIIFMKIFQKRNTRWSELKEKVINVPLDEEDILNTVTNLPRTPHEAGLIEVELVSRIEKPRLEKDKQMIDPEKCFKLLDLLKRSGNKYYQAYDDYNVYAERCKKFDSPGHALVFEEEVELMEDLTQNQTENEIQVENEVFEDEKRHKDWMEKDSIRRFQFRDHNQSVFVSHMYPETRPENSVTIAPGEGKVPKNILYDTDWDIKAFPALNSPDGKYGLHHERKVKLGDQYYFNQRILNENPKFAKNPAFLYAAVAHTELKQIQRNINISFSRGKQSTNFDGTLSLKVDDPFAVLDNIKQTPRYWKKNKYELFAKIDNFGRFQFFYTLSCGELRWEENIAAILKQNDPNITVKCEVIEAARINNDNCDCKDCRLPETLITVEFKKNGLLFELPIADYIKQEIKESLHEIVRGNVLIATRYFNHRVKAFTRDIIMGGGNLMNVDKFHYKTEFQDRG